MRIYTLLLLLLFTHFAIAQYKPASFLQQYKFRTPNFRSVFLSGNANGNINALNSSNNAHSFSLNPKLDATRIISTDKILANYTYEIDAGFNYNKANIFTGVQRNTNFNYSISQSASQKKYKQSNFSLTGYSGTLKHSLEKNNNNYQEINNMLFTSVSGSIGIGKGRIENVTDAQMAWNILSELKKNNLLAADFADEDIEGLAKTITQLNNTRLFDFRRKYIFELKQIDSFLNSKGLIKEKNIGYFTTVNDNWFYAFNQLRRHGKEKFITLSPSIGLDDRKTVFNVIPVDSTSKYFSKFATVILSIGIDKAKAVNIKRQHNKGISLTTTYGYNDIKNTNNAVINTTTNSNIITSLNGYLQWGYYPNTRTSINTYLTNNLLWAIEDDAINNNTSLYFTGNYFINYNTRIFVNVGSNVNINRQFSTDFNAVASANFSFGLQHFIR